MNSIDIIEQMAHKTHKLVWILSVQLFSITFFSLDAREKEPLYSSEDGLVGGALSDGDFSRNEKSQKTYSLYHLETLRKAVPPRYIRYLDWKKYAASGKELHRGILVTYYSTSARQIFLSGDFNNWSKIRMNRNRNGVFYFVIPIREIEKGQRIRSYTYRFLVDGVWTHDPLNANRLDDGLGGYRSKYVLDHEDTNRMAKPRVLKEAVKTEERLVEFSVHESHLKKKVHRSSIENVSVVGDFNHWNPESDLMQKDSDGIFRLRLRLKPGQYAYRLVVDGKWVLDPLNEDTGMHSGLGELTSVLRID